MKPNRFYSISEIKSYLLLIILILTFGHFLKAESGDVTPPLKVHGRYLEDPCGNQVLLHGVAMTPSPWFNGCALGDCRWNNYDVAGCLSYNKAVMDRLTNSTEGWYLNYVRLHIDPYWSNTPGQATDGESDISAFDFDRFVSAVDHVIVPLIAHAKERGMYVILRPPGVCPHEIAVGDEYHTYLKTIWAHLAEHPDLRNADHVMFELANEPVRIKGTNGEYGSNTQAHFDALKLFFQPIVDMIREKGAKNILWIPGSGWQAHYKGYANNPVEGENIAYAVHIYPGYWGQDNNDPDIFRKNWNENIKPVADFAPIAITEIDWGPEEYNVWGKGGVTGKAGEWGFGANFKALADESGNVSWNLLAPENLIDSGYVDRGIAFDEDPDACALPVYNWFQEYAQAEAERCERYHNAIYEIAFAADDGKVIELDNGQDINGTPIIAAERNFSNSQRWRAQIDEEGYWYFISMSSESEKVITWHAEENKLVLGDQGDENSFWELVDLGQGLLQFKSKAASNEESWELAGCNLEGSEALSLGSFIGGDCQRFRLKLQGSYYPYIPPDHSDEIYEIEFRSNALKVVSVASENGAYKIYPQSRKATNNQRWRVLSTDGYWQFIPLSSYSARPLAIQDATADDGMQLTLGADLNDPSSFWKVVDLGNGYYQILSRSALDSERYSGLDVPDCDMNDGTPMQLSQYSGALCQQFRMHYIKDYDPKDYVLNVNQVGSSLSFYPNPLRESSTLTLQSDAKMMTVKIVHMNGQEVYRRALESTYSTRLNMDLQAGIYLMKIQTEEGMIHKRLIVK